MDDGVINLMVQHRPPEPIPDALLERMARWLLDRVGASGATLSVVLSDDETVQALNRQYRGVDAPTDVLSFAAADQDAVYEGADLGDLIIAVPYLARQASAQNHTFADELLLAVVHGALHLLGYDHDSAEHEEAMWALQAEALALANIRIDVPRFFEGGAPPDEREETE